ncbi:MEDS domain-containing protein [Caballeronia novacaledonica]|uniref:MEDS domain-containing protein n=1 Tax=Caballeronia novacaledonica TaxID=1544861 RepID=UPI001EE15F03|nr:MEDS domain-containing protein [Caballeronia novacaledonica]GJH10013.1 MEDS domain-containing protein [Caballeronia novacaledonica]
MVRSVASLIPAANVQVQSGEDHSMCNHAVQFYENDWFLCERVANFIHEAAQAGEPTLVIVTRAHREEIERVLGKTRDLASASTTGPSDVVWLDAEATLDTLLIEGWPNATRCESVLGTLIDTLSGNGRVPVRAFGEMVAILCARGESGAALRLEQLWNDLARKHAFSLLCAYPTRVFKGSEEARAFHAICSAHDSVLPPEAFVATAEDTVPYQLAVAAWQHKTKALELEIARRADIQRALSELSAHQHRIRENERKRIAREIHDELGSVLTGIKAYVSVAVDRARREGSAPDPQLVDAARLADDALDTVRRVITELRPTVLDDLGIWVALEWYIEQIEKQTGLPCSLTIDPRLSASEVGPELGTVLFRIIQEALTNAVRHAQAKSMVVRAQCDEAFAVFEVCDDGKGIDAVRLLGQHSWGIAGMHERARHFGGALTIAGAPGMGTTVSLRLPLETLYDG